MKEKLTKHIEQFFSNLATSAPRTDVHRAEFQHLKVAKFEKHGTEEQA